MKKITNLVNLFVLGALFVSAPISLYAEKKEKDFIIGLVYDLKAELREHGDTHKLHALLDSLVSALAQSMREKELEKQLNDMRTYIDQLKLENQYMRLAAKHRDRYDEIFAYVLIGITAMVSIWSMKK